jgi:tetrahydromethanopterin S-methyltransferase subunit F
MNESREQAGSSAPRQNADRKPEGEISASLLSRLSDQLDRVARNMEAAEIRDYIELTHKPVKLIIRNLISGTFRGIGIAIGFTFFAATIVYILQMLGKLNLPIVGDYIADIVRIVQQQLQINPY